MCNATACRARGLVSRCSRSGGPATLWSALGRPRESGSGSEERWEVRVRGASGPACWDRRAASDCDRGPAGSALTLTARPRMHSPSGLISWPATPRSFQGRHVGWRITRRTLQLGVNASHDSLSRKAQMIAVEAGGPDQGLRARLMLPRKTRSRVRRRRRSLLSAGVSPAASISVRQQARACVEQPSPGGRDAAQPVFRICALMASCGPFPNGLRYLDDAFDPATSAREPAPRTPPWLAGSDRIATADADRQAARSPRAARDRRRVVVRGLAVQLAVLGGNAGHGGSHLPPCVGKQRVLGGQRVVDDAH